MSFSGDEETTTLAALALLQGWPPELPGGLFYLRALPFTALEAVAVALGGTSEFGLRLIPVLLSAPRIAAAWWLARPLLGGPAALCIAALLAVSPFDVEMSRNARMYSLFGTLDVIFLALVVRLVRSGRGAGWAGAAGALTVLTHALGVLHAPVPVLAALARGIGLRRALLLTGVSAAVFVAFAAELCVMDFAYSGAARFELTSQPATASPLERHLENARAATAATGSAAALAIAGALAALGLTGVGVARLQRWPARLMASLACAAWLAASPVLGASGLLAALMLEGTSRRALAASALPLAAAGALASAGWLAAALVAHSGALEPALRLLLGLPAPNWFELGLAAPLLCGLALVGLSWVVPHAARDEHPGAWLAIVGAALGPVLLAGLVHRQEALRYHYHAWVPLLVLAWLGTSALAARFLRRERTALVLAFVVMLVAVRPDQALRAVTRDHGIVDEPFAVIAVAPDHRGAGEFLRGRLEPTDWVAAEDPLQQYLYAGRADLWLRRIGDSGRFLVRDPEGGPPRDSYVGSRQVGDLEALRALAAERGRTVVWLVTSGEVEAYPEYYRSDETHQTLLAWRPLAWFVGADGLTHVYRLVDGEPVAPPNSLQ